MSWLARVRFVAITDRTKMVDAAVLATRDWPQIAAAFGEAVGRVAARFGDALLVQVREKDLDGGALLLLVRAALATGARVLVNDRVDVALAAGAHGVHLPEHGLSIADARAVAALVGRRSRDALDDRDPLAADGRRDNALAVHERHDPFAAVSPERDDIDHPITAGAVDATYQRFIVGISCHSIDGVERATTAGADLVQLGPIWETPGKPTPLGPEALAEARRVTTAHLVAIGGIDESRVDLCRQHGADAVAAIRAVWARELEPR